jgi:ubiquinone/menaquinone biosynthesis C-methylase UbiE/MoaA/NifB/PqqE/SkfB family radical SAM enzyme
MNNNIVKIIIKKYQRFIKFCVVGGIGWLLQVAITYILTEYLSIWYILSMCIAVAIVVIWNYLANAIWTFSIDKDPDSKNYDWNSYYNGNIIQKWWKHKIANIVWGMIPHNSTMLDIGCGSSPLITHYPNAVAIDINEDKLQFIKSKIPTLQTYKMSADELQFKDKSFDNVMCIEVLEHINNAEKAISEIARVLKHGGTAIIATPDYSRRHWYLFELFTAYKGEHISKHTRKSINKMCEKYGLIPVKEKYVAFCDYVGCYKKIYTDTNEQYNINYTKHTIKTVGEVLKRITIPTISKATIMLTNRCNYMCLSCNIWCNNKNNIQEITPIELETIISKNNLMWGSFTGGEISLCPELADFITIGAKKLKVLSINTNGSNPQKIEYAIRQGLKQSNNRIMVSISLEGDKYTHEKFTRIPNSWDRAIETIKRLKLIKTNHLKISIEYLISQYTANGLEYIQQLAKDMGISIVYTREQIADYYGNTKNSIKTLSYPEYSPKANILDIVSYAYTKKGDNWYKSKCVAGQFSCFITSDCKVYPCLFKYPEYVLCDLRETEYKMNDIYKNSREIVKLCSGCNTPCEQYPTLIYRPWYFL